MAQEQSAEQTKRGLAPIIAHPTKVLILGSMPSEASIAKQQYYGHPQNAFWSIMQSITEIENTADYKLRCQGLQKLGIAVWDVIASCVRPGSLDSAIKPASIELNPLLEFIQQQPGLKFIGLNGGKAFELFQRHWIKSDKLPSDIQYTRLPSTSPAYTLQKQAKLRLWRNALLSYL